MLTILPNQLFDVRIVKSVVKEHNIKQIVIYCHEQYFDKYAYNKIRLHMVRSAIQIYITELKADPVLGKMPIKLRETPMELKSVMFDPIDKIKVSSLATILESPNFLLTSEMLEAYHKKLTSRNFKRIVFNSFYEFGKEQLGIKIGKSQDTKNRERLPESELKRIPPEPEFKRTKTTEKIIADAAKWVQTHYPNNPGTLGDMKYPVSGTEARDLVKHFMKKLGKFGTYEDAMVFYVSDSLAESKLYHSGLSAAINLGLLNPAELIVAVNKPEVIRKCGLNNVEGFIRQLFWREYQRFCYKYFENRINPSYGNQLFKPTLTTRQFNSVWYPFDLSKEIGIKSDPLPWVVRYCINQAFATGYLHHIQRLMVIGSYMLISGVNPKDAHRWFMEFSCDSYEWVMCQNVFDMVFACSGMTMSKIYICSSNYIKKMSIFIGESGTKINKFGSWDDDYRKFVEKNKKILSHFRA